MFLRRVQWRRVILGALLLWLLLVGLLYIAIHGYGYVDRARDADVIIVLGAGLTRNNTPTATLRTRATRAAELWATGHAPYVICTGAVPRFATISEAEGCRRILVSHGVPDDRIILEENSRSTLENALNTADILAERGWESAVVVSSRYHLLRAYWLFSRLGITTYTSPANISFLRPHGYFRLLTREIAAMHWQVLNDVFNLPYTSVPNL